MKFLGKRQLGLLRLSAIAAVFVVTMLLLSIAPAGAQGSDPDVCLQYDDHGVCTLWSKPSVSSPPLLIIENAE